MGKLIFLCGKMAAGKSTLARQLAARDNAVLFVQDQLLDALYPGAVINVASYIEYSTADEISKAQLKARSQHLPPGTPWTTEADYELIASHFSVPSDEERFNVIHHRRA